jgi:hypothetical protein
MKNYFVSVVVMSAVTLMSGVNDAGFWDQLTTEERAATGLTALTPEQQKKLNALAERFSQQGAQRAVEVAKAEVAAEVERTSAARAGLRKEADEVITSRIAGKFNGWSGRTLFRLENGQTWVQADSSETYWVSEQAGPEVELRKGGLAGWKMQLLPKGRWVRVKRVN